MRSDSTPAVQVGAIDPPTRGGAALGARWRIALGAMATGLALMVVAFAPTWQALAAVWSSSESYAHGYVIAPIVAWLFWRERDALLAQAPGIGLAGIATVAAGLSAWWLGALGSMAIVQFAGLVVATAGVVMASIGDRLSWRFAFPIAFLVFMIPLGEGLVPTLVDWTADATVAALRATGFPVYREGRFFTLPTGRWEVEAGCSGLRYLIAAVVLAVLFAYLYMRSLPRRVAFVGFAIVLSLIANWVRAYLIVLIGHFSEMRYGTGEDHLWYGWAFFGLVMAVVFWIGNRWSDLPHEGGARGAPAKAAVVVPASIGRQAIARLATLAALAAGIAVALGASDGLARVQPRGDAAEVAGRALGARSPVPMTVGTRFEGARYLEHGRLGSHPGVEYLVGYYAAQVPGSELVTVTNEPVDDTSGRWRLESENRLQAGPGLVVNEVIAREGDVRWLVWHWYTADGEHFASPSRVKLATLRSLLRRGSDDAAVTVLSVRLGTADVAPGRVQLGTAAQEARRFSEAMTRR
jgi:exosortase A